MWGWMVGWLVANDYVLGCPPFTFLHSLTFSCKSVSDLIFWMAWYWSRWSVSIVEFGSLHKIQWGCGRINNLWRWAATQLCSVYSLKRATFLCMEDLGLICCCGLIIYINSYFYFSFWSLLLFFFNVFWVIFNEWKGTLVMFCRLISVPLFDSKSALSFTSIPQWERVVSTVVLFLCESLGGVS